MQAVSEQEKDLGSLVVSRPWTIYYFFTEKCCTSKDLYIIKHIIFVYNIPEIKIKNSHSRLRILQLFYSMIKN